MAAKEVQGLRSEAFSLLEPIVDARRPWTEPMCSRAYVSANASSDIHDCSTVPSVSIKVHLMSTTGRFIPQAAHTGHRSGWLGGHIWVDVHQVREHLHTVARRKTS